MAYQSLYRKYRPQQFSELIGQEHVVSALRNAVRDGRVAHAYFFSGPRGTGKTTTARILAKALNCTNLGADGEPCGECTSCAEITHGSSLDVVEIDAASNNGVDEIRDLIERVAYRSAGGGRKVYIVDEVHELSARASNALLKTLEEPPDHVVFVLATTNPEKVLPTIRSRTQPFEFSLLTSEQLVDHLTDISAREGVKAEHEALELVARRGAGSVRDSLSLLDQALAQSPGELTLEQTFAVFGGTPIEHTLEILRSVAAEDVPGVLVGLSNLFDPGHDPRRVSDDLLRALRDALLVTAGAGRVRISAPEEERAGLAQLGEEMGTAQLVRGLETIGKAVVDMRGVGAPDPRLVLEVALVRLARRDSGTSLQALADRVERLERGAPATAGVAAAPAPAPAPAPATPSRTEPSRAEPPPRTPEPAPTGGGASAARRTLGALKKQSSTTPPRERAPEPVAAPTPEPAPAPATAAAPRAEPVTLDDVIVAWAAILPTLPPATRAAVQEAQPVELEDDVVVLGVPPKLIEAAKPRLQQQATAIREALAKQVGTTLRFKLVPLDLTAASQPGAQADEPPMPDEPPDIDLESFDPSELSDAPVGGGAVDSVSRLVDTFGASVVEERPR